MSRHEKDHADLLAEVERLRTELATLGQPTVRWGVQIGPGVDTYDDEDQAREWVKILNAGTVVRRTEWSTGWSAASNGQ